MRLVLDTNILIAALIKDSVTRRILLLPDLEFLLPAFALDELARHRAKIVRAARLIYEETGHSDAHVYRRRIFEKDTAAGSRERKPRAARLEDIGEPGFFRLFRNMRSATA